MAFHTPTKPTTGWATSIRRSTIQPTRRPLTATARSAPAQPITGCTGISPGLGTSPNPILAGVPLYLNGIGIPEQNGVPKGLVNNHWANFGPRLGFAYDLTGSGKMVVRGGFGIMYERIQGNDMYNAGPNIPFSFQLNTPGSGRARESAPGARVGHGRGSADQPGQHHRPGDRRIQTAR